MRGAPGTILESRTLDVLVIGLSGFINVNRLPDAFYAPFKSYTRACSFSSHSPNCNRKEK